MAVPAPFGGRNQHSGRDQYDRILMAERILTARVEKRESVVSIAKREGISMKTAYRYLNAALERREVQAVEAFRKQENEGLDAIERQNDQQIELSEHLARKGAEENNYDLIVRAAAIRDKAIARRISLADRRAKLNGLDAPVQVQATVTHLDAVDAELADLVRRAEQAAEETRPS